MCWERIKDWDKMVDETSNMLICKPCQLAQVNDSGTIVFNPIKLEHLALCATLRTFGKLTSAAVESGKAYAAFKNVCGLVKARDFMFCYDNNKYTYASQLITKVEQAQARTKSGCDFLSKIEHA